MSNSNYRQEFLKKILLPFWTLFVLLFTACVSAPNVYTFILDGGIQQDFIRPVELKDKLINASIDFTVHTKDGNVTEPVVVNYSLTGTAFEKRPDESIMVFIVADKDEYAVEEARTLFKSYSPDKIRRSGVIDGNLFKKIVYASEIKIKFVSKDSRQTSFDSARLKKDFAELRGLIEP